MNRDVIDSFIYYSCLECHWSEFIQWICCSAFVLYHLLNIFFLLNLKALHHTSKVEVREIYLTVCEPPIYIKVDPLLKVSSKVHLTHVVWNRFKFLTFCHKQVRSLRFVSYLRVLLISISLIWIIEVVH